MSEQSPAEKMTYWDKTSRAWYVRGYPSQAFTFEQDAINALEMADSIAQVAIDKLADKIREVLP